MALPLRYSVGNLLARRTRTRAHARRGGAWWCSPRRCSLSLVSSLRRTLVTTGDAATT